MTPAGDALRAQDPPCLVGAIGLSRLQMHSADALQKLAVLHRPAALRPVAPLVIAAARHAEHGAHPCHLEEPHMPANEGVLHGSSRAKYAAAFFRMSRSSVTFASSRLRRATSPSCCAGLRPGPQNAVAPLLPSCSFHL